MLEKCKKIIHENNFNTYFISVASKDYNIVTERIVPANPTCNCYSVAKAFVSFAIGILYDKGLLKTDMLIVDIFKKYLPKDMDSKWNKVTIHDVLQHKVGFGSGLLDIDCEDASNYPTFDYLDIILNTKLKYEAGTHYQYTDAAFYLLSRIVFELSGIELSDLLRPILMEKMRFKEFAWSTCPYGYSIGATGLYIRTEDMVKLGVLYLNKGLWKGERIVSEDWIDISLEKGYGFSKLKNGWYGKGGMIGQFLIFNFEENKAIACHSYDDNITSTIFI